MHPIKEKLRLCTFYMLFYDSLILFSFFGFACLLQTLQKSGTRELQNTNHQIDIKFTCPGNLHPVSDYVYIITNEAQKYHPTGAAALAQHSVSWQRPPHLLIHHLLN